MSAVAADAFQTWLRAAVARLADGRKVIGAAFSVRHGVRVFHAAGDDWDHETPFFIASATKLFTTALILQLCERQSLSLDSPVAHWLDGEELDGWQVYGGQSHAQHLTVRHLLAHTSGLPDYFEGADAQGTRWHSRLLKGEDFAWTPEQAIARAKRMKPRFAPGTPGKASYSDTNFQLLGQVIERAAGEPLARCYDEGIVQPLGLRRTYLYTDPTDTTPRDVYHRQQRLRIPLAMASFGADGGMVSTAPELLRFVDAFFSGQLFARAMLPQLQEWHRISFPLCAGVGLHPFRLPWLLDPLRRLPPMMGHSGLSGALADHCPQSQVSIAGSANPVAWPGTPFRLGARVLQKVACP